MENLDTLSLKPTNKNPIKVSKVFDPKNEITLLTSIIYSPMFPRSLNIVQFLFKSCIKNLAKNPSLSLHRKQMFEIKIFGYY